MARPKEKTTLKDPILKPFQFAFNGTWKPGQDGTMMKEGDFKTLTNMRYTELGIKSVFGSSKINSTQLTV